MKRTERSTFVCHDKEEYAAALRIDPEGDRFISSSHEEYLNVYARAKAGTVNRIHAAFALASFGRPSFVIGSGSHARMVDEIELQRWFVNGVRAEQILDAYSAISRRRADFGLFMRGIRERVLRAYEELLSVPVRSGEVSV